MNKRDSVRYGSELLPGSLSKASIAWEGNASIGSYVVNYCAQGVNVIIPPLLVPYDIPKEKDDLKVRLPIDQKWFAGTCVYARLESDGSVSLGINFTSPEEQNYLKDLLFHCLNTPTTHSFVSYEWEELVGKMCDSDDPRLSQIGQHHREVIRAKQDRPHSV
jgi:hypothetical protein